MVIHVTGQEGFIAQHLIPYLKANGHTVASSGKEDSFTPWVAMEYGAPDVVIHLGAVGKHKPINTTVLYNVASTACWAKHCAEIGARFLYVTTYESAGLSWYAQTKRWGEQAASHFPPLGGVQIVELGPVYGHGSRSAPMEMLLRARAGVPIQAMEGSIRCYLHISDVVWALELLAVDNGWNGRTYVQRNDDRWDMVSLARYCCQLYDRDTDALVDVIPHADGYASTPLFQPWGWPEQHRAITVGEGLAYEMRRIEQFAGE